MLGYGSPHFLGYNQIKEVLNDMIELAEANGGTEAKAIIALARHLIQIIAEFGACVATNVVCNAARSV